MRDLFDPAEATKKRDDGLANVSLHNEHWLDHARIIARAHCLHYGSVTSDDVRKRVQYQPHHPNAYGAIFRDDRFEPTGEFRQSTAVSRRGGMQRVWRLKKQ